MTAILVPKSVHPMLTAIPSNAASPYERVWAVRKACLIPSTVARRAIVIDTLTPLIPCRCFHCDLTAAPPVDRPPLRTLLNAPIVSVKDVASATDSQCSADRCTTASETRQIGTGTGQHGSCHTS